MWFGNANHAQWVPAPASDMERQRPNFSEFLPLQNGALWGRSSFGNHSVFNMEYPVGDPDEYEGIEAFARFASGEYSRKDSYGSYLNADNYLRFADPMLFCSNIFPPAWASPGLLETGDWPNLYIDAPTFSNTSANIYGKPARKATWTINNTNLDLYPPAGFATFLIPQGYTLHIGASGSVTNDGLLSYRVKNLGGTYGSPSNITMTADNAAPAYSVSIASTTAGVVQVYMRRTGSAGTVTITSAWATLAPTGVTPTISRHLPGQGAYGCIFADGALPQSYVLAAGGRKLVGASMSLAEVEASQTKRRI
jgi:hypothetical protein